jgi:hypothetical protein
MKPKIDSVSNWVVVILISVMVVRANGPEGLGFLIDFEKSDVEVAEHYKAICSALKLDDIIAEDEENGLMCIRRGGLRDEVSRTRWERGIVRQAYRVPQK